MRTSPQHAAAHQHTTQPPRDGADTVTGCGVMGVPFESGDYLALRRWPVSSFGPGYTSVWHRTAQGEWTIYADAPPEVSCARFMSSAVSTVVTLPITMRWTGADYLHIDAPPRIEWTVRFGPSTATRALSRMAGMLPAPVWRSDRALWLLGGIAGVALGTGTVQMTGITPNGHRFRVHPLRLWMVRDSRAHVDGVPTGPPRLPEHTARIGPVRLPRRGLFFAETSAEFTPPGSTPDAPPSTRSHVLG